jgi:RNA polymerase sigma-70 factor (ECF subfamily)
MAVAMAKIVKRTDDENLVLRARTDAETLGQLYDIYYEPIFRFCLCRVFHRETAEDITSGVFLAVARQMSGFKGRTKSDFGNWLYRIAANHANAHIRKTWRRKQLFAKAAKPIAAAKSSTTDDLPSLNWPMLYAAILKLKPRQQTVIILRFFQNMEFDQIAKIVKARPATVRVSLHRTLRKLKTHLQTIASGGKENVRD